MTLDAKESEPSIAFADDAPAVSIVNSLLNQAVKDRASDIHIEPHEREVRVRYRIDGVLRDVVAFPRHSHDALISRVKIMSGMDIAEKRLPQDGRIRHEKNGRDIDFRVSTLPTIMGEKSGHSLPISSSFFILIAIFFMFIKL